MAAVEIAHPLGKIRTVVGGGDPVAALGIDPVGAVARKSRGQNGRTIFQRDGEHSGFAARRQFQFIAEGVAHAGCAATRLAPVLADADKLCGVVFDRCYPLLLLRIPPFVRNDAVSAGIASGEQGGVSGSGAGVGVIVVAIGEISAAIEKHTETAFAELVAIAFQVVAAKLVNHDDDNQLGASVVSGRGRARDQAEQASATSAGAARRGSLIAS